MKLIDLDAKESYLLDGKYIINISKKGKWIYKPFIYWAEHPPCIIKRYEATQWECSECGYIEESDKPTNYCANCGANMKHNIDCTGCSLYKDGGEICDMCAMGEITREEAENKL